LWVFCEAGSDGVLLDIDDVALVVVRSLDSVFVEASGPDFVLRF
jgi:hypothetical protein